MGKYFGTDGIRKITNTELTPELAYKVAKAGAYVLSQNTDHKPVVLIGKDTRISGDMIETAMISGFLSYGVDVKSLGIIPTPAVAYLTRELNCDAGVLISASHNSYEFNGIKFFGNKGMKISDDLQNKIEEMIDSPELTNLTAPADEIGHLEYNYNLIDRYADFICETFEGKFNSCNLKVAIDTANGATYKIAPKIFTKLGIPYEVISNTPDGININDKCGSTHLEALEKKVTSEKFSFGFAYDGDGDRCLAIDDKGQTIDGDITMAILADHLKKNNKLVSDTIVATVMSNLGLHKFAKANNLKIEETAVGDRYVLERMLEKGYNLGGEQSGHIILLDKNPTGDGILTSLMLLEAILESGMTSSEARDIMKLYPQALINAKVPNGKKMAFETDEEIIEAINQVKDDLGNDGRLLIRPSGTEPLVRVMIEGPIQAEAEEKAKQLALKIEKKFNNK